MFCLNSALGRKFTFTRLLSAVFLKNIKLSIKNVKKTKMTCCKKFDQLKTDAIKYSNSNELCITKKRYMGRLKYVNPEISNLSR